MWKFLRWRLSLFQPAVTRVPIIRCTGCALLKLLSCFRPKLSYSGWWAQNENRGQPRRTPTWKKAQEWWCVGSRIHPHVVTSHTSGAQVMCTSVRLTCVHLMIGEIFRISCNTRRLEKWPKPTRSPMRIFNDSNSKWCILLLRREWSLEREEEWRWLII